MRTIRDSRGISLVEVAVVGVLATIVMLALTGFYINSQGAWIDASAQAVTQREATFILQVMSDNIHAASSATVTSAPTMLHLWNADSPPAELSRFWISSDSLIHMGVGDPFVDQGPLATSMATRFDLSTNGSLGLVRIDALELRTSNQRLVRMSGAAAMFNR